MQRFEDRTIDYRWWEKTVEYAYLAKVVRQTKFAISPFAGNIETNMGDAIAFYPYHFGIIEFKRSRGTIKSECEKYNSGFEDYRMNVNNIMDGNIRKCISEGEEPHSLIYGYLKKDEIYNKYILETEIVHYWWNDVVLDRPKTLRSDLFSHYLEKLAEHRNTEEVSSSSGGSIFGFDGSGNPVIHIDLRTALRTYDSDYDPQTDPNWVPAHSLSGFET